MSVGDEGGLHVRLLGPPTLAIGAGVSLGSAHQRVVLAALGLSPGKVVTHGQIASFLWGDDPPASARATVRSLVYRLRKAIEQGGGSAAIVRGESLGWTLDVEPAAVDLVRFAAAAATGRAALERDDPRAAAELLAGAVDLWRGPAFGDEAVYPGLRPHARRRDDARLTAAEDLAEAELALGRAAAATDRMEQVLAIDPLRERAWAHLMVGRCRLGRPAAALAAYRVAHATLADLAGLEPGVGLRDLEARILRGDPALLG